MPFPFADAALHPLLEEITAGNMTDYMLSPVSLPNEAQNLGVVWENPNTLS